MKIKHHIAGNWSLEQIKILKDYGYQLTEGIGNTIIEEDENYFKIKPYLEKWQMVDIRFPDFTLKELKESPLSAKNGSWQHGYPMPDMDRGYLYNTYDTTDYCENCGVGLKQKNAFRIKNDPPKGKKRIFKLIWIDDELFVDKSIYADIIRPLGIKSREVVIHKKNISSENFVQLILPTTEEQLELHNNYPRKVCDICHRVKFQAMPIGFYPLYKNIKYPIFKSKEYFGEGANAFKRVFIVKELRDKLIDLKIEKNDWYFPSKGK